MSDDIEFDDPEAETEALRGPDPDATSDDVPDANVTGFDDDAVAIEQDPAQRADADDRIEGLPDELSPGEDIARGDGWGEVEPNEPA